MKKRIVAIFILISAFMSLYTVSSIVGSDIWGDILSPLTTLGPGVILLVLFFKEKQSRGIWLFAALATLTWCLTDIVWGYTSLILGEDPNESLLIGILYLLPNLFLSLTSGYLLMSRQKVWDRIQMLLNILVTSYIGLAAIWMIFLKNEFAMLASMDSWTVITFIYVLSDVFCICCVVLWGLTIGGSKISNAMLIFLAGILLYTVSDLIYAYQYFQQIYEANSLLDVLYLASFFIMSCGGLRHRWYPVELVFHRPNEISDKRHHIRRSLCLVLIPIALKALQLIDWIQFLGLVVVLIIHQIFSTAISSARINAKLIQQEKNMNRFLEEEIENRTRELLEINRDLEKVSNYDMITNFYNRRYFMNQLNNILKESREPEQIALFFADIDRFKAINDTFGHDIGDQVLVEIGRRIVDWNIYNATIARLGGDEFVLAIRDSKGSAWIAEVAQALINKCNEPLTVALYQFHISISIGITLFPVDARDPVSLLRNADIAMYHAKAQGSNQHAFFSSLINDQVRRKSELEILLRNADFNREFTVHYQPQFTAREENLTGFEAFLCWESPAIGLIQPKEFIEVAEETGLIIPISEWLLQEAVEQISIWNAQYQLQLRIATIISPKQLDTVHFIPFVKDLIANCNIQPEWLDFEIIENIAISNAGQSAHILETLSGLGIKLTIDDFGVGYSSLSYLKKFAVNRLKISRVLTENIETDNSDYQIVKASVMMAKAMGIQTVGYVEKLKQIKVLADLGCDEVQGDLFGRPMPADEIEVAFLKRL